MSAWWSYRPSDFLMFSARTWGRLLQAWNRELWPWQLVLAALALLLLAAAARRPREAAPSLAPVLALAWAWVGWSFHWQRFSLVNTGATWSAAAFGLQALLLLVLGTRVGGDAPVVLRRAGLAVALAAIVLYPLLAPLTGRGWAQAEVVGAMPGPTALFTLGLLLALPLRHRAWLLAIPMLELAVGWVADGMLWAPLSLRP